MSEQEKCPHCGQSMPELTEAQKLERANKEIERLKKELEQAKARNINDFIREATKGHEPYKPYRRIDEPPYRLDRPHVTWGNQFEVTCQTRRLS